MFTMTSYFSIEFLLIFLPAVILLYGITPGKVRRIVLLAASYLFFWAISGRLLVYLLISTFSAHHFGLWLSSEQRACADRLQSAQKGQKKEIRKDSQKRQRRILAFAAGLQIGVLLLLKYTPFFAGNINQLMKWAGLDITVQIPVYLLPIGISFYTLQAVSYLFDVYRNKIPADENLLRLALFLGFFPQIMEGPICRYDQTAHRLYEAPALRWNAAIFGIQRILFGAVKKVVVADRLNLFVKTIFGQYPSYDGFVIFTAAVCYTVQLYMDFSGTMDVVIGIGQIFGIELPENFRRPFFSRTVSEFWMRWHITLGTWFKDYLFYPLSMSGPLKKLTLKARKKVGNHYGPLLAGAIAVFCVWFCNGLWHGAGWNYLFFGMYHFVFIMTESLLEPLAAKVCGILHVNREHFAYRCMQIARTGLIVCVGELFFRAEGLRAGVEMFRKIVTDFRWDSFFHPEVWSYGLDKPDAVIMGVVLLLVFVVGILQERNIAIRERIARRPAAVQFAVLYSLILFIVVFGAYGSGYLPVDPMYAAF